MGKQGTRVPEPMVTPQAQMGVAVVSSDQVSRLPPFCTEAHDHLRYKCIPPPGWMESLASALNEASARQAGAANVAADQFSPAATRALGEPHKVAREYALAAAKICETSMLQQASVANARRLLKAALALLEG